MLTIGIPTINRWDLLESSLSFYLAIYRDFEIIIIDNGAQGISQWANFWKDKNPALVSKLGVFENAANNGVAGSWNQIIENSAYDNFLILNDDICIDADPEALCYICNNDLENKFFKSKWGWGAIMFNFDTYKKVGQFDEKFFPAYFEDNDYSYRLKLADVEEIESHVITPTHNVKSMSIAKDPALNSGFQANRVRYIEKWGGLPGLEKFKTPFNDK